MHRYSNHIAIPNINKINVQIPRKPHLEIEILIIIWAKSLDNPKHNMIKTLIRPTLGE